MHGCVGEREGWKAIQDLSQQGGGAGSDPSFLAGEVRPHLRHYFLEALAPLDMQQDRVEVWD